MVTPDDVRTKIKIRVRIRPGSGLSGSASGKTLDVKEVSGGDFLSKHKARSSLFSQQHGRQFGRRRVKRIMLIPESVSEIPDADRNEASGPNRVARSGAVSR